MKCAFCEHSTELVMDMGRVALAGGFLRQKDFANEQRYTLRLAFCPACFAVQVADPVSPAAMFTDYFYFSSATETARRHFKTMADQLVARFRPRSVVEIGCNDGVLLRPLAAHGLHVTGVDPSNALRFFDDPSVTVINDYFGPAVAQQIIEADGHPDMIIACNVLAHVEDVHAITAAARDLLADDGVLVMEAHHLGAMVSGLQYDWVYHEHRFYYSLLCLKQHFERHGLSVFDVDPVLTHGGSMRYFIDKGRRPMSSRVRELMAAETAQGLDKTMTFMRFAAGAVEHRERMQEATQGRVAGYGACGRANSLIQFCGLDLAYVVDDAPAKQGFYTPGSHIPVVSRDALQDKPDAVLLFAWTYLDEIRAKCPGIPLIVPFPTPVVIQ